MKLLSVASARPNFVKLAAIDHACRLPAFSDVEHVIVHTGQHYDPALSDVFFEQLKITQPAHNLGVHGGTREEVIDRTTEAMLPVLEREMPDMVLVYGDVNGAVGAARAAKKLGIRLAHVEAGLRSGDLSMPEELNRIEVDSLADILLCSEASGMKHLEDEKVPGKRYLVGNTMIDTLIHNERITSVGAEAVLGELPKLEEKKFAIATIHRPSNVDNPKILKSLLDFFSEIAAQGCPISLIAHPRLKNALTALNYKQKDDGPPFVIRDPLSYFVFISFLRTCSFILTDSGGIQEEAMFLKKRCFTLRRNTERPSTIDAGSNVLIDPSKESNRKAVLDFAKSPLQPEITVPALWDGKAGERILSVLRTAYA